MKDKIKAKTLTARLKAIKKSPETKRFIDKLIVDRGNRYTGSSVAKGSPPSEQRALRISANTTQSINDTTNIMQLLPDTELAKKILVSSILSPKDLTNVELSYQTLMKELPSELTGQLVEVIRKHFDEVYSIKDILTSILEESLFDKGSYPLLVLPEGSIDAIINSDTISIESLDGELNVNKTNVKPSIGVLGSPKVPSGDQWSLESFNDDPLGFTEAESEIASDVLSGHGVYVTDNFDALKMPSVVKGIRKAKLADTYGLRCSASLEQRNNSTDEDVTDTKLVSELFKSKYYAQEPYVRVTNDPTSMDCDNPLIMKLPAESVIPVHTPSNPEDHVGYFVLIDLYGNPINNARDSDYYRNLSSNVQGSGMASKLLESGVRGQEGVSNRNQATEADVAETVRLYSEVVEKDLLNRLKNGVYGDDIEISRPMDVYSVMLARSLAQKGTQILYVPKELLTYITFDYNADGVGKSLLEDNKILASMRAMMLFSNTMAAIKNSTPRTGVKIELDPDDPDPSSTVEFLVHEYMKVRQGGYPLHASSPMEIIGFLQNAGVDIQVSGNSAYPETRIDVEDYSSNKVGIDSDLEEDLKRKYFMSLGLSPETIEMSGEVDFATSIVSSNLLLAKRVINYQDRLMVFIKDFIRIYSYNSGAIRKALYDILDDNKSLIPTELKSIELNTLVSRFIDSVEVSLPRPESAKIENQQMAFEAYSDFIELAIDAYMDEDSFETEGEEDIADVLASVKSATLSHYKRVWLRNNNVLPELMDIVVSNGDDKPLLDLGEVHGNHVEALGNTISTLVAKLRLDKVKRDKAAEKLEAKIEKKMEGNTEDEVPESSNEPDGDTAPDATEGDVTPDEDVVPTP